MRPAPVFDGVACLGPKGESFGFVVFRTPPGELVQFECSQFAWPPTDEGRLAARQQLVRVLTRLQAEHARAVGLQH